MFQQLRLWLLVRKLSSPDISAMRDAAKALGQLRDPRAIEPLIALLQKSKRRVHEEAAAEALGQLGDSRAVKPLIRMLRESSGWRSVHRALQSIGEASVVPLIASLDDSDNVLRMRAADVLGYLKDGRAIVPLVALLQDREISVRHQAATSLRQLKWTPPDALSRVHFAIADANVFHFAIANFYFSGCVDEGAVAVEPLVAMLKDRCPEVRKASAKSLAEIRDIRAVEPLINALGDRDESVRAAVAGALGSFGDDRAIGPLLATVSESSDTLRPIAAGSLGTLLETVVIARVTAAQLRKIAELRDVEYIFTERRNVTETDRDGCRSWVTEVEERTPRTCDLSDLRQLARQELIRRGESA